MSGNILAEQAECLRRSRAGETINEIAAATGLNRHQVRRRLQASRKREKVDPRILAKLDERGYHDLHGLNGGWVLDKENGSGLSLRFEIPGDEPVDVAEALHEVLRDLPRLPPLDRAPRNTEARDHATWLVITDLHVGGHYGHPSLKWDFQDCIDDIFRRVPAAEHCTIFELGDLLDANDHKGVTPASGNPCDVIRGDELKNGYLALELLDYTIQRALQTHDTVDVEMIRGNHDETAYLLVLVGLAERYRDNARVKVNVTQDEFRVVAWGQCAAFPHHGDTLSWAELKDVFSDQFSDEWAAAKALRFIMTGHLHHGKRKPLGNQDLTGAYAEQFRTIHQPNAWARMKGLFSYGSLSAITVHKDRGETGRVTSPIRPMLKGKTK